MGSLDNWSSDEGDGIMENPSRSRRSRGKLSARPLRRSVSILSNLSEVSESVVFGAHRRLNEREARRDYSSAHVDGDWLDDPSDDLGSSASSSSKSSTVGGSRASGSDDDSERLQRRRSYRPDEDTRAGSSSSASTGSRPIAIPRSRQSSSASASTLPEPLSARGERQGGYFPFHENPQTRVRHTHPFYRDTRSYDMDHSVEEVDTGADADVDMPKPRSQSQYELSSSTRDSDLYWLPSDDEDSEPFRSASMGRYYPPVYERRQAQRRSGMPVDSIPSSSRTPAQPRTPRTPKYRPRPKTPVIVPRSAGTTEPIPPLKLSPVE